MSERKTETVSECAQRLGVTERRLLKRLWVRAEQGKTTPREAKMLIHTLLLADAGGGGGPGRGKAPDDYSDFHSMLDRVFKRKGRQ